MIIPKPGNEPNAINIIHDNFFTACNIETIDENLLLKK